MLDDPRSVCAVLLAALVLAGCGGATPAAPEPPPRVVTVVQDDAELLHRTPERIAATLDDLRAAGVDWVRVTAGWDVVEPQRGVFVWTALDQLHALARARDLRLNIDIAFFLPPWLESMDVAAYADFAEKVARRYPDAAAFTVWNEPNLATFLRPQWRADGTPASPDTYGEMVRAAVPRIEEAAPRALVLIGATSSLGESEGRDADTRMAPLTFLRALAAGDGPPLPGDGWSHHPYTGELAPWQHDPQPETARMGDLDRLTDELHRLHEAGRFEQDLPVYVTEYGDQTNPPDPTWDITPADQARRLAEGERIARANPRVRSVSQFLVRDLPERPGADLRTRWRDYQSGLFFADGRPKPARAAFALPLTARREAGRVAFWGLVRPGSGRRPVRILADGKVVAEARTRADGTFTAGARVDLDATFTAVSGDLRGAPLAGARQ